MYVFAASMALWWYHHQCAKQLSRMMKTYVSPVESSIFVRLGKLNEFDGEVLCSIGPKRRRALLPTIVARRRLQQFKTSLIPCSTGFSAL